MWSAMCWRTLIGLLFKILTSLEELDAGQAGSVNGQVTGEKPSENVAARTAGDCPRSRVSQV